MIRRMKENLIAAGYGPAQVETIIRTALKGDVITDFHDRVVAQVSDRGYPSSSAPGVTRHFLPHHISAFATAMLMEIDG